MSTLTNTIEAVKPALRPFARPLKSAARSAIQHAIAAAGYRLVTKKGEVVSVSPQTEWGTVRSLINGTYEHAERSMLARHFESAKTVIELGSNIGIVASTAIHLGKVSPRGRLICVEPNPQSLTALQANVERAIRNNPRYAMMRCDFINAAVGAPGNEGNQVEFLARTNLSSGPVGQVAPMAGDAEPIQARMTSLSEILSSHSVHGYYSLVCDIEGGEIPMIFRDAAALETCGQMVIELHNPELTGRNVRQPQMIGALNAMGFHVHAREQNTYYLNRFSEKAPA